ncbi:MAG: AIR carboxylase family protein [Acidimicrobiales bacterium]|nr:AIR carboxylase family protein [Acidimicrobiales bacterium]
MSSLVVVLSGSPSDADWVAKIRKTLDELEVPNVWRVGSAHRVPEHVLTLLTHYDNAPESVVFITVAGMSDALSGLTAANVSSPVIACPPAENAFGGLDVLSSLRTPPGVDPLTALHPTNAALAAAKILALQDPALKERIRANQAARAKNVLDADSAQNS